MPGGRGLTHALANATTAKDGGRTGRGPPVRSGNRHHVGRPGQALGGQVGAAGVEDRCRRGRHELGARPRETFLEAG